jgi:hypothetical protein
MTPINKIVRVRASDHALEILDEDGRVHLEVRPGYQERLGPLVELHRVGIHGTTSYMATLRLPVVSELVRKLPIVFAAARRLQNGAPSSPRARTPQGRRTAAK